LRILGTPFDGSQTVTSVAMYHTTHNQVETRAPIRGQFVTRRRSRGMWWRRSWFSLKSKMGIRSLGG